MTGLSDSLGKNALGHVRFLKNPSVPFKPDFPEGHNSNGANMAILAINHVAEPTECRAWQTPVRRSEAWEIEVQPDRIPDGKSPWAFKAEVVCCFQVPMAELTEIGIRPAPSQEGICREKPLLSEEPQEEFAF